MPFPRSEGETGLDDTGLGGWGQVLGWGEKGLKCLAEVRPNRRLLGGVVGGRCVIFPFSAEKGCVTAHVD